MWRRYSDLAWLYDELIRLNPGSIIPPLPERQVLRRFNLEFIEMRREAIERFLRRAFQHPTLGTSGLLFSFMQASDSELTASKLSRLDLCPVTLIQIL